MTDKPKRIYQPRGPKRMKHQREGLKRIIKSGGVFGLLWEPGTGKTATVLDYASILALKSPQREIRVLVLAPLAAVDAWVGQSDIFVANGVTVWAEALGGSIPQRADSLAARAGTPPRGAKHKKNTDPSALNLHRSVDSLHRAGNGDHLDQFAGPRSGPAGEPRLIIESMGLDSFARRDQVGSSRTIADVLVAAVKKFNPDLIVVDESHRIKGNASNTSRAIARLTPLCNRRIILTGTVMPHSPLDVFGQWRFLAPQAFGRMQANGKRRPATWGGFQSDFARLGGYMGKQVMGFKHLDKMRTIMSENAMTVRKRDVMDLPPVTDITIPVHLSTRETKAYGDMTEDLAIVIDDADISVPNKLAQMMRLRQITSGYVPDERGNLVDLGKSKVKTIKSLIEDTLTGEKRIVVFAFLIRDLELLAEALKAKGVRVDVISGDTKPRDRIAIRRHFGSDSPTRTILLAQVRTMSLSVNELVTASHAIFASLPQTRDDYTQARDRLNRKGQTQPVTIWHAQAPGTIDDVILESHIKGTNLEASIIDHINSEHEKKGRQ